MNNVLVIEDLTKEVKKKQIVQNISFELDKGDVFALLGPNGAGKSTTVKMILGLVKPSSGTIILNGFNVLLQREEALKTVGAMVENSDFYNYMSGYKNLELYANMYGLKKDRIIEVLELVNLTDSKDKKVKKYSLGMKQRLGIARAFLNNPKFLILDEPTNGLDPVGVVEIRKLITKLSTEENVTFFICSHILGEMQSICNKIAILDKGKMLAIGDMKTLMHESNTKTLEEYYLSVLEGNN